MEAANGKTMAFALLAENRYGYPENHTDKFTTKSRTRTAQRWTVKNKISPPEKGGDLFDYIGSTFGE